MAAKTVALDQSVPAFSLPSTGTGLWASKDAAGSKLVLYFYPRDNTPGCTLEGKDFAAAAAAFRKAGAVILGISADSLESHEKFKAKMQFPFELLADTEQKACKLFAVIKEKSLYGRKFMGIERSTFLIDSQGVLRNEWRKVKVQGHVDDVLAAARAL
jgi:peroxiredoxin Q/BCP